MVDVMGASSGENSVARAPITGTGVDASMEPMVEPYDQHRSIDLRSECYRRGVRPVRSGPRANDNKAGYIALLREYDRTHAKPEGPTANGNEKNESHSYRFQGKHRLQPHPLLQPQPLQPQAIMPVQVSAGNESSGTATTASLVSASQQTHTTMPVVIPPPTTSTPIDSMHQGIVYSGATGPQKRQKLKNGHHTQGKSSEEPQENEHVPPKRPQPVKMIMPASVTAVADNPVQPPAVAGISASPTPLMFTPMSHPTQSGIVRVLTPTEPLQSAQHELTVKEDYIRLKMQIMLERRDYERQVRREDQRFKLHSQLHGVISTLAQLRRLAKEYTVEQENVLLVEVNEDIAYFQGQKRKLKMELELLDRYG
ncbi:hypothetical protein Poli38472_012465 [Pythium oligandrum]|uniref:Uncharacterized protein n=1 Tax=Pythium oligandrum TaxID=41045 RepID=A0A8K1FNI0_PYTOL|nr:hypothetical protein Poli38472_012465 [Pythium oligandrum]|eukprot:TMW67349.1 hypothetical protein Poli38472_012465 [Pythium oligandrum]